VSRTSRPPSTIQQGPSIAPSHGAIAACNDLDEARHPQGRSAVRGRPGRHTPEGNKPEPGC
jgi:hypothetical protein